MTIGWRFGASPRRQPQTNSPAPVSSDAELSARSDATSERVTMQHLFTIEELKDGQWVPVKSGLCATLAAFGAALAVLKAPGAKWRAVRDDGQIFCP